MSDEHYNPRNRLKTQIKRRSSCRNILNAVPPPPPTDFEGLEGFTDSCPAPTANNPFKVEKWTYFYFKKSIFRSLPRKRSDKNPRWPSHKTIRLQQVFRGLNWKFEQSSLIILSFRSPDPLKTPTKGVRSSPRKRKSPQKFERFQSFDPVRKYKILEVFFKQKLNSAGSSSRIPSGRLLRAPCHVVIGSKTSRTSPGVCRGSSNWSSDRKQDENRVKSLVSMDEYEKIDGKCDCQVSDERSIRWNAIF